MWMKSTENRPNFFVCESRDEGRDFDPAKHELPSCPLECLMADGGFR